MQHDLLEGAGKHQQSSSSSSSSVHHHMLEAVAVLSPRQPCLLLALPPHMLKASTSPHRPTLYDPLSHSLVAHHRPLVLYEVSPVEVAEAVMLDLDGS